MPDEGGQTRLADFRGGDDGSDDGDDDVAAAEDDVGEGPAVAGAASDARADPRDEHTGVAPATPTATWSPDGAPCDGCGSVVRRRWRDGEATVCDDCAEW